MEGCNNTFLKNNKFWKQEEIATFLLPIGQNIGSNFVATVDSSSMDPICGKQRSLAANSLSLARIHGKCEKIVNLKSVFLLNVVKIEENN